MKKIFFYLLVIQVIAVSYAGAQSRVVNGQVSDSSGEAIVGATIVEKGFPANGTSTNASGNFKLNLKGTSNIIIVTNVGFIAREVAVGTAANTRVILKNAGNAAMNEVVVVGYGRQKKVTLTGAVSTVTGKELRENPTASLQNTLSGRLPGFFSQQSSGRPGNDGATFFIRGQSSYNNGSNTPLIIVDDIEFSYDQFARLDPNEIETLSILKDASTTAVYGVKGANGVVVVTTRRGSTRTPQISLRVENSLNQPTIIPHYLDAYETALLYSQAEANDNVPVISRRFRPTELDTFKNNLDPYGHPNVNWRDVLFKKFSKQYRANFDISGGSEKVKYFISLGYLNQDGILKDYSKNSDVRNNFYHNRYNYRSNLDMKITSTTDLRLDLFGNIGETNTPSVGSPFGYNDVFYDYSSFLTLSPFAYPIYNPNGTLGYSAAQRANSNYNTNNIIGRLTNYGFNRSYENNITLNAIANQRLDFITKGLSVKGTVSYASNYGYSRSQTRSSFPSFIYTPSTNTYEPRDANVFRITRYFAGYGAGSTIRRTNFQAMINYDRTFNRHRVYGLILMNQSSTQQFSSNSAYNFVPNNFRGFTGRAGYNYKEKYLFEFNAGYNGSDLFSEKNRYGFFPAVSAGWNISSEPFFSNNIKVVDRLKIRGSYGLVGNDKIGSGFNYFYVQTYAGSGSYNFGNTSNNFNGIAEGRLPNENVTWEKEKKLDIGLEFGLFKNKLNGTVEYFNNNRFDILTNRGTVSAVFGQALPPVNLGEVNNSGYEIELNYAGNIGKDFGYRLKGTYSVAKNKIVFQDEPSSQYAYQAYTGHSIGQQRVYQWTGTFYKDSADIAKSPRTLQTALPGDLKYEDLNGDGLINQFDQAVLGFSNVPNTTYGFQIGFNFKGFNISAFFQGAKNFNVRAGAEAIRPFSANLTEVHKYSWTPALGDNAKFPRLTLGAGVSDPLGNPSTFWFIPGDYLRLKTAEFGYTFPKKITERLKIQALKLYANGYNLLTWTKLDQLYELDPEILPATVNTTLTTDRVNYPPQRTFNFGLSVTF